MLNSHKTKNDEVDLDDLDDRLRQAPTIDPSSKPFPYVLIDF